MLFNPWHQQSYEPADTSPSAEERYLSPCRCRALIGALFRVEIVLAAVLAVTSCGPRPQPPLVKGPCDLSCPPVSHEPAVVHLGDSITFTFAVSNAGPGSASCGAYELEFYVDDHLLRAMRKPPTIPPGRAVFYSKAPGGFHIRAATTGVHSYVVIADPKNTLKETDESNNVRRGEFQVWD